MIPLFLTAPVSLFSFSASEYNLQGCKELNEKNYEKAIASFESALNEEPGNAVYRKNLAIALNNAAIEYEKNGDFPSAYNYLKKAVSAEPGSDEFSKNFAVILRNEALKRYKKKLRTGLVIPLLEEALQYDGANASLYDFLGQVYYDSEDELKALAKWKKAVAIDPSQKNIKKKLEKLQKEMKAEKNFLSQEFRHFKVRFNGFENWEAAWKALNLLDKAYYEIGGKFYLYPDKHLTAIIYTGGEFQEVSETPVWTAGLYDGKIRVKEAQIKVGGDDLKRIIYHEYTHAIIHYYVGDAMPVWLNEGYAQYCEMLPDKPVLNTFEKEILKKRIDAWWAPDFGKLDEYFVKKQSEDDTRFAYAFSKSFVIYLAEKGGEYNLKNLLDELRRGVKAENAFDKVYFKSLGMLVDGWKNNFKE